MVGGGGLEIITLSEHLISHPLAVHDFTRSIYIYTLLKFAVLRLCLWINFLGLYACISLAALSQSYFINLKIILIDGDHIHD